MKIVPMKTNGQHKPGEVIGKGVRVNSNPPNPTVVNLDEDRRTHKRNRIDQNRARYMMTPEGYLETKNLSDPEYDRWLEEHDLLDDWEGTVQVIALDPGGTTGWSLFEVHPEAISGKTEHRNVSVLKNVIRWQHGQIDCGSQRGNLGTSAHAGISTSGENAGIGEILGLIRCFPHAAVVVEDFVIDAERLSTERDFLSPVRITSALSYDLWLQKREYRVQMPALAKSTCKDEQLKAWGFYSKHGGLNHARDADRHALTFLKRASAVNRTGYALRSSAWPALFGPDGKFSELQSAPKSGYNEEKSEPVPDLMENLKQSLKGVSA